MKIERREAGMLLITGEDNRSWLWNYDQVRQAVRDSDACRESRRSRQYCGCQCCRIAEFKRNK